MASILVMGTVRLGTPVFLPVMFRIIEARLFLVMGTVRLGTPVFLPGMFRIIEARLFPGPMGHNRGRESQLVGM